MKLINWLKRILTSRYTALLFCFILEILFIVIPSFLLISSFWTIYIITILNIIFVIYIINKKKNSRFKVAWIAILCIFPFVGIFLYLIFADKRIPRKLSGYSNEVKQDSLIYIKKHATNIERIKDHDLKEQLEYVQNFTNYPCFSNTSSKYFASGAEFFEDFIKRLNNAKEFVFIEFFIVKKGDMFDRLYRTLKKKIKEGVRVYFMLDDLGCLPYNSSNTIKQLKKIGVNVAVFSKVSFPTIFKTSYRDHRKIIVIDNKYAYTGGINIADEYIGKAFPYGKWKDSALLISGKAVSSYSLMFIQFFNYSGKYNLKPNDFIKNIHSVKNNSYILPFSDSPTDEERIARNVQLNMITNAKKFVYISTPYLVIDDEIENALIMKAKTNVKTIILVPGIPDKKFVFMATRSHYAALINGGVEIYEYKPGFMHSKLIVCDNDIALEGSINLDFRSHFLQFESGCIVAKDSSIKNMTNDFLSTIKESKKITSEDLANVKFLTRVSRAIVNMFAPLF